MAAVFSVAERCNVQVFATIHNWDCTETSQKAIQPQHSPEGLLISLQRKGEKGDVVAVLFNEEELTIIAPSKIEVR